MSDLPKGSPQSFQVSRGETLETGIAMVSNQPGGSLSVDDQIAVCFLARVWKKYPIGFIGFSFEVKTRYIQYWLMWIKAPN